MPARQIAATRLVALLGSAATAAPAYRGVADGIRLLIADGRLTVGTRLPSERDLTGALGVSRTTVSRAYAELRDCGYLISRRGSGSVAAMPGPAGRRGSAALRPGESMGDGGIIDLTCAATAAPPGTAAAYEAAVQALPAFLGGTGYHPLGLPRLREAVAERFTERGLPTEADQVMVTSGALAGLALTARALVGLGDRVLMESPTYPNAIETVRRSGARPVALPLERGGWDTEAVEAGLRQTAPRAAVLLPDFQNPTGALMSDEQRTAIGRALSRTCSVGIVDETLAELADDGRAMPPPLAAFSASAVTLGSSSKAYWGGIRTGWVRAPRDVMPALVAARLTLDLGAPVLEQLVLLELMRHRADILSEHRARLGASRTALVTALREALPEWRFSVPDGGLSLWVELPTPLSTALTVAAEGRGVLLAAGPQFAVEGGLERFLRIPFTLGPEVLQDAVGRIALAWQDAQSQRPGALAPPLLPERRDHLTSRWPQLWP